MQDKLFVTKSGTVLCFDSDAEQWNDAYLKETYFANNSGHPIDGKLVELKGEYTEKDFILFRAKYFAASCANFHHDNESLKNSGIELEDNEENLNTIANLYADDADHFDTGIKFNDLHSSILEHLELVFPEYLT